MNQLSITPRLFCLLTIHVNTYVQLNYWSRNCVLFQSTCVHIRFSGVHIIFSFLCRFLLTIGCFFVVLLFIVLSVLLRLATFHYLLPFTLTQLALLQMRKHYHQDPYSNRWISFFVLILKAGKHYLIKYVIVNFYDI